MSDELSGVEAPPASWRAVILVFLAAAAIHSILLLAWVFAYGGNITGPFVFGDLITTPAALAAVQPEPIVHKNSIGYDGQYYLLIGLAPFHPRTFPQTFTEDNIPYRYGRIVWPMLAHITVFGQTVAVPWSLAFWNILLLALSSALLSRLIQLTGHSPWWGLLLAISAGSLIATSRMMNDAATVCAVLGSLLIFQQATPASPRKSLLTAYVLLAVAILARETSAIFLAAMSAALFLAPFNDRPWRIPRLWIVLLTGAAFMPWLLWQTYLRWQMTGMESATTELGGRMSMNFALPLAGFWQGVAPDLKALAAGKLSLGKIASVAHQSLYLIAALMALFSAARSVISRSWRYTQFAALALALLALITSYEVWVELWAYGHVFFLLCTLVALEGLHRKHWIYLLPLIGDALFSSLFILREWWRVLQSMA